MPAEDGSGVTAGSECADRDPAVSSARTILVVEDEAFVREVVGEILRSAGYRVLMARNAAEALFVFHRHHERVQLLLADVVLPDRNGCDLASEFALLCRGVRIVFISGYPENAVTRKGFQRPGWFYLPKPFSGPLLIQKITEALEGCSM
jgi:two-component system cell cycle sensor histidine kinase/response regulator CckA